MNEDIIDFLIETEEIDKFINKEEKKEENKKEDNEKK